MTITKKKILATFLSVLFIFSFYTAVNASLLDSQEGFSSTGGEIGTAFGQTGQPKDPRIVVARLVQAVLGFMGVILVVFYIYAGYLWMTASGNDDKVSKAKQILQNATIGLVIVMASYAITKFVIKCALEVTSAASSLWYCGN